MVQTREERNAWYREYRQRPGVKVRELISKRKYHSSAKGSAKTKEYSAREYVKENSRNYKASDKGKATTKKYNEGKGKVIRKLYNTTPKRIAAQKAWGQNPVNRERAKKTRTNNRLKVLQVLSKRLSNSDIPCCNCCGLNSHLNFLDLDHILGKYEMDSIPELVELGYSSTKAGGVLNKWIKDNNYLSDLQTEYFQILCKNCNGAKSDYGKCPMENKPH